MFTKEDLRTGDICVFREPRCSPAKVFRSVVVKKQVEDVLINELEVLGKKVGYTGDLSDYTDDLLFRWGHSIWDIMEVWRCNSCWPDHLSNWNYETEDWKKVFDRTAPEETKMPEYYVTVTRSAKFHFKVPAISEESAELMALRMAKEMDKRALNSLSYDLKVEVEPIQEGKAHVYDAFLSDNKTTGEFSISLGCPPEFTIKKEG